MHDRDSERIVLILVVEDEDAVRAVVRRVLTSNGYRVLEARRGTEALQLVADLDLHVDLVLTDLVLPDMSGGALGDALRKRHRELPILYMSGYMRDEMRRRGVIGPDARFIQKPFSASELAAEVGALLASHSSAGADLPTG